MNRGDQRLVRHLAMAVAVKLALLAALWWLFVREASIPLTAEATAAHIARPTSPQGGRR